MSKKSTSTAQLSAVATDQLSALSTDQVQALGTAEVLALSTDQLQALVSDQVLALSTEQLGALDAGSLDSVDAAPVAPKLRRQVTTEGLNVHTMRMEPTVDITEEDLPDSPPAELVLAIPHAFYDEGENLRSWSAGQSITDPEEMMLLIGRGAVFKG